jgi:hypothetical protein
MPHLTKSERIARRQLLYHMWLEDMGTGADLPLDRMYELAPLEWHTIEADIPCFEPKEKITLYLDRSVARTFKAMGKGYQARINRLLHLWLQMKIAGLINEPAAIAQRRSEMIKAGNARGDNPGFGPMLEE